MTRLNNVLRLREALPAVARGGGGYFDRYSHVSVLLDHVSRFSSQGLPYCYEEIDPYEDSKGSSHTKTPLSIDAKRERYPDFIRASPWGLVPALEEDNAQIRVCESVALMRYLDEAYTGKSQLMPQTPIARAVSPSCQANSTRRTLLLAS